MSDPLGLIRNTGGTPQLPNQPLRNQQGNGSGPDFKNLLMKNLNEVNSLQQDASEAAQDLITGKRNDLEGVVAATEKAETAFKMLQAMRNQVMQAYDEIKQMRV
jgi:flagellar hook-basal body complex protein FliE